VARDRCSGRLPLFSEARGGDGVSRGLGPQTGGSEESGDLARVRPWGRFIGRRASVGRPIADPRAPTTRVMLTRDAHRWGSPFGAFRVSFFAEEKG
jgi:hypothetical protein